MRRNWSSSRTRASTATRRRSAPPTASTRPTPTIRYDRMQQLVDATKMPMVLHGGTGLTTEVYKRLISLGAAKVNISTALKKTYADGFRNYLEKHPTQYDPLKLIGAVQNDVITMAQSLFKRLRQQGTGVKRALHLRLRRRPRRHRARRPSGGVQPDVARAGRQLAVDASRSTRRSSRSAEAKSAWRASPETAISAPRTTCRDV